MKRMRDQHLHVHIATSPSGSTAGTGVRMSSLHRAISISSIFLLLFHFNSMIVSVSAAHARKRPVAIRSASNSPSYDKQITTFDPRGQLLQVQYSQRAAEKGSSGLFLKVDGAAFGAGAAHEETQNVDIIVAVVASASTSETSTVRNRLEDTNTRNTRTSTNRHCANKSMYRMHDGIMAKMTGLQGDSRLLSRHLLSNALRMNWYEGGGSYSSSMKSIPIPKNGDGSGDGSGNESVDIAIDMNAHLLRSMANRVTVKQVADVCAEVQHSLTMRPGARPLAVDAVLFGLDGRKNTNTNANMSQNGNDNISAFASADAMLKLGLYRSQLTGLVEECKFCVVGNICVDRLAYKGCLEAMELLWSELHEQDEDKLEHEHEHEHGDMTGADTTTSCPIAPTRPTISNLITTMGNLLISHEQKKLDKTEFVTSDSKNLSSKEKDTTTISACAPAAAAVDIYIMRPNAKARGGVQITCATCVTEEDLQHVANLFQIDVL